MHARCRGQTSFHEHEKSNVLWLPKRCVTFELLTPSSGWPPDTEYAEIEGFGREER